MLIQNMSVNVHAMYLFSAKSCCTLPTCSGVNFVLALSVCVRDTLNSQKTRGSGLMIYNEKDNIVC